MRALNDELRITGRGGETYVTPGVLHHEPKTVEAARLAVREFAAFTPKNDPWQQHDYAIVDVPTAHRLRVMFKIDYYDLEEEWSSTEPADPRVTTRVLTIMLPEVLALTRSGCADLGGTASGVDGWASPTSHPMESP